MTKKKCRKIIKQAVLLITIAFIVSVAIDMTIAKKESRYSEYKPGKVEHNNDTEEFPPKAGVARYF